MRRLFWIAFGATVGILLVRRASRAAERLTPAGIAEGLSGSVAELALALREFNSDVRAAMSEREQELRDGFGLDGRHDAVDAHMLADDNPLSTDPDEPADRRSGGAAAQRPAEVTQRRTRDSGGPAA